MIINKPFGWGNKGFEANNMRYQANYFSNRTDEKGEFTVEVDSFIGRQVVALSPQTRIRHSENINYTFSLDRYFSPVPRFFHYHEKHFEKSPANNEINCDNNTPPNFGSQRVSVI